MKIVLIGLKRVSRGEIKRYVRARVKGQVAGRTRHVIRATTSGSKAKLGAVRL